MWLTSKELVGIPDIPTSVHKIREMLDRRSNESTKRKRQGTKAFEYHISCLPSAAQAHFTKQQLVEEIELAKAKVGDLSKHADKKLNASSDEKLIAANQMSESSRKKALARLSVLNAHDRHIELSKLHGVTKNDAILEFVTLYNSGQLPFDAETIAMIPSVAKITLYRWGKGYAELGLAALADNRGGNVSSVIDTTPELKEYIIAFLSEFPHAATQPSKVRKALSAEFKNADFSIPHVTNINRWVKRWVNDNASVWESINNPDAWKNNFMVAHGNASSHITGLNQLWELDATPADLLCTLEDGKQRRYHITGLIDVYSRRPKLLVTETPRTESNACLLRKAILEFGKPLQVKLDNGSDYVSYAMFAVLDALDIDKSICPPFSPWKKPHIERLFRTFSHDLLELQAGFVGHNVNDRSAIESRKAFSSRLFKKDQTIEVTLTPEELQVFCDDWVNNIYMHNHHSGLDNTPFNMVAGWNGEILRISNERALDQLLSTPSDGKPRTVTKKGVKIDNIYYSAPELAVHTGQQVQVRYDKDDLGQIILSELSGEFICVAVNAELAGVNRQAAATEARRLQRESIKQAKKEINAIKRKVNVKDAGERIIESAREDNANIVAMPKIGTEYTNASIEGAAHAVAALEQPDSPVSPTTMADVYQVSKLLQEDQQTQPNEQDRFVRWMHLRDIVEAGKELSETDAYWKTRYEGTPEYSGRKMVLDDFGNDAFPSYVHQNAN